MSTAIAEAIFDQGLLDRASAVVWGAVDAAGVMFYERPWLVVVVAVIVVLVIWKRH